MLKELYDINVKGFADDKDVELIWKAHDSVFEPFKGSRTCQECVRIALQKTLIYLNENPIDENR